MKRIYVLCLFVFITSVARAVGLCGPAVSGKDYAYSFVKPLASGINMGFWVIGSGCDKNNDTNILGDNGFVSSDLVNKMCENGTVMVRGQALCSTSIWSGISAKSQAKEFDALGPNCWCRRTKMLNTDGDLVDSVGPWIVVGNTQNSSDDCVLSCSKLCAKAIVDDTTTESGYAAAGNAIMMLSAN